MLKNFLSNLCLFLFGRRNYYRLARFLWLDSRRDGSNEMRSNGEFAVQSAVVRVGTGLTEPVFFDIGANVGECSANLLKKAREAGIGNSLRLFCFEPNPKCIAKIQERIAGFGNRRCVTIVPKIVTDEPGQASFFLTGETAGSSSLRIDDKTQRGTQIDAECITIDGFCSANGIDSVLFAKVDTEGNDMRVLDGATEMLRAGRICYLQFEYNHRWILFRNFLKDVFELVEPLGYKVAKVTSEGLEVYPRWHFELEVFWEGNYLIGRDFESLGLPLLESEVFG